MGPPTFSHSRTCEQSRDCARTLPRVGRSPKRGAPSGARPACLPRGGRDARAALRGAGARPARKRRAARRGLGRRGVQAAAAAPARAPAERHAERLPAAARPKPLSHAAQMAAVAADAAEPHEAARGQLAHGAARALGAARGLVFVRRRLIDCGEAEGRGRGGDGTSIDCGEAVGRGRYGEGTSSAARVDAAKVPCPAEAVFARAHAQLAIAGRAGNAPPDARTIFGNLGQGHRRAD